MLKDADYAANYHRGGLAIDRDAKQGSTPQPIRGAFQNTPERVAASKSAILSAMERRRSC
jgi:hypothetical protein